MKIVVIGSGPSGIIASLKLSDKHDVTLIDSNDKIGKKILLTGNGKCNYWSDFISRDNYYTDNYENLEKIISNKDEVLDYLYSLSIYPSIKNGYYYPNSMQASSIREIFERELKKKVNIITECKVTNIINNNNSFIIKSNLDDIVCDKVVIACGSKAYPKTGSDGSMFNYLEKYHKINPVLPSLVALKGNDPCFKEWSGIRSDCKVNVFVNNNKIASEEGEIQLTDYGVSGIVVYNISSIVSRSLYEKKYVELEIDFFKDYDFYSWFNERNKSIPNHTMQELLESIFPYKLMYVLLNKAGIDRNSFWDKLNEAKKREFSNLVNRFHLNIEDTLSYDRCQVCTGGVSLNEINPNNMESLFVPGLYIIGEALDVDGKCGGFNLAFSFITGFLAGSDLND